MATNESIAADLRTAPESDTVAAAPADGPFQALPDGLKERLSALARAPQQVAELAISLFPFGYRALLEAYDLIAITSPSAADGHSVDPDDPRQRTRLTPLGRGIIDACADDRTNTTSSGDLQRRGDVLREKYGDELPFVAAQTRS